MIRIFSRTPKGDIRVDTSLDELTSLLQQENALLWLDFQNEPPEKCEPILLEIFNFHPLAIDDALQESHVPRVDDWGEYLYVVLAGLAFCPSPSQEELRTLELDVFLGHNYLVTHHDEPLEAVDRTWLACQRDRRHSELGPDHLLYRLADELVAGYMPIVEGIDDAIDRVEDNIFLHPKPEMLAEIFALKRSLLQMRRVLIPQREVLNKLARDDYPVIDAKDRVFFRDVYDHLVRLHDINESLRDLVSGALDVYLSVVNNRMNDIMKILTVFTALFMPLSFLVGFFGMNFFEPFASSPFWTSQMMLWVSLAIMIISPLTMYLWMRRHGWM
jgi:magnesium transporter